MGAGASGEGPLLPAQEADDISLQGLCGEGDARLLGTLAELGDREGAEVNDGRARGPRRALPAPELTGLSAGGGRARVVAGGTETEIDARELVVVAHGKLPLSWPESESLLRLSIV